jgi:hypothetical protein
VHHPEHVVPPKRPLSSTAFKPGQSGNPSGRPKAILDVIHLARTHTPMAIGALVKIATSKTSPPAAIVAASVALLDRGWGRPSQTLDVNSSSTIELHLIAARAISSVLIAEQKTPQIQTIEATSTDLPTE